MNGQQWPLPVPLFADRTERRLALSGRVAVVTGASGGLGAACARVFADAGLRVGLCGRRPPEEWEDAGPSEEVGRAASATTTLRRAVDVARPDELVAFAEEVWSRFDRIDLWVNNAAVLEPIGPLAEAHPAELERHFDTNVMGVVHGTRIFARHVRQRPGPGVLLNISSGAAITPYEGWAPYCSSKAATDMLTRAVALEEVGNGLRAHAVAPGVLDTPMQARIRRTPEDRFPERRRFVDLHRSGGLSDPDWVADRLLELAFAPAPPEGVILRVPTWR